MMHHDKFIITAHSSGLTDFVELFKNQILLIVQFSFDDCIVLGFLHHTIKYLNDQNILIG